MPAKSKIIGDIEIKVREMCEKGYNATHIGKQVGLSKDTVKVWAEKNGYVLTKVYRSHIIESEDKIVEMLKSGYNRKQIQKSLKVSYDQVGLIAEKHGLSNLLRTRKEAVIDKVLSYEEVAARIPDNSKYLGYIKEKGTYSFQCAKTGKIFYKTSGKIHQGSPFNKSGHTLTEEEFAERLKLINYTLKPGTYTKTKNPVVVYCDKGHERDLNNASYAFSFNCPVCGNNGVSKQELEIFDWVKSFYPSAKKYKFDERITKPKEIDIYIPELKLGIEYCGLYWHNEENIEDGGKHYKKMLMANQQGIRLITIFENEWIERKDQVKGFLKSAMQLNSFKVYARECEVRPLSAEEYSVFMDTNHIQGAEKNAIFRIGILFQNEIIGAMSLGKHPQRHSLDDSNIYLNRMSFKSDCTVVGGASKMFSMAKDIARQNGFKSIVSWSDNRWSEGSVYRNLGFEFSSQKDKGRGLSDGSVWPDFQYAIGGKLYSRSKIESLGLSDSDLRKIYDCGKKRWVFKL